MMRRYIVYICCVVSALALYQTSYAAQERDLSGVDIVSRHERGANESRTWKYGGAWNGFNTFLNNYAIWLEQGGADPGGKFARRQANQELTHKREQFLKKYYPIETHIDRTTTSYGTQVLIRPRQYHANKTKIIIHHTAGSAVYDTPTAALSGVRDIYKFHTLNRGRGDIGYHFLIDPYGRIYEGRAGGPDVVAAHANRNNVSTIGIALMGNFDTAPPTDAAWEALQRLTLALALKYDIDPYTPEHYFTAIPNDPWLEVHDHDSVVGHQDTKNTACPGSYVYERLPALKQYVTTVLKLIKEYGQSARTSLERESLDDPVFFAKESGRIAVHMPVGGKVSCEALTNSVRVQDCSRGDDTMLQLDIVRTGYPASGKQQFLVDIGSKHYIIDTTVVWQADLDLLLQNRKEIYGMSPSSQPQEKMTEEISLDDLAQMDTTVHVLLYDASTTLQNREMSCTQGCTLVLDDTTIDDIDDLQVMKFDGILRVITDEDVYETTELTIENEDVITVENYDRMYAGLPMNTFKGDITIRSTKYKHLIGGRQTNYVLINTLSLADYLEGVGEISTQQHPEKIKTMALLAKAYTLFYLNGVNEHPSIPEDAPYNAVDDPRIFQKYLGANFVTYSSEWIDALQDTEDSYIIYDGYLPILPYFHCSAGFTHSGREAFGWTDTPWLVSQLDVTSCTSGGFEGHGVGLSGDGAEAMARAGMTAEQIIKRRYKGVEIEEL